MRPNMVPGDRTSLGGPNEVFQTTQWTEIIGLRTDNEGLRREILNRIISKYWKPVYCYLRRKGYDNEEAKDLTQGFVYEILLGRDLVDKADRAKGRFRTYLLTALSRYATSAHRAATAEKKMPRQGLVRLDEFETACLPGPASGCTPEDAFNYAWASALLDQVLDEVRKGYDTAGKTVYWEVFAARVVGPILDGTPLPPLSELCARHGIADESTASNMIITVKRRFRAVLHQRVRPFVDSETEVEAEIRDLMSTLSRGADGA